MLHGIFGALLFDSLAVAILGTFTFFTSERKQGQIPAGLYQRCMVAGWVFSMYLAVPYFVTS